MLVVQLLEKQKKVISVNMENCLQRKQHLGLAKCCVFLDHIIATLFYLEDNQRKYICGYVKRTYP